MVVVDVKAIYICNSKFVWDVTNNGVSPTTVFFIEEIQVIEFYPDLHYSYL